MTDKEAALKRLRHAEANYTYHDQEWHDAIDNYLKSLYVDGGIPVECIPEIIDVLNLGAAFALGNFEDKLSDEQIKELSETISYGDPVFSNKD